MLTGEGADGGWSISNDKAASSGFLDVVPGLKLSELARRCICQTGAAFSRQMARGWKLPSAAKTHGSIPIAYSQFQSCVSTPSRCEVMNDSHPWGELGFPLEKPNAGPRSIVASGSRRGSISGPSVTDQRRPRGHAPLGRSSLPFLDEVFDFTAKLPTLEAAWIPRQVSAAPARGTLVQIDRSTRQSYLSRTLDSFHMDPEPLFVAQLLSDSLRCTGYFDVGEVTRWRKGFREMRAGSLPGSPWKWGDCGRATSSGINSWAADWRICLSGPPPKHLYKRRSAVARPHHPSFCRVCFPISFISGSSFSLSAPGHHF